MSWADLPPEEMRRRIQARLAPPLWMLANMEQRDQADKAPAWVDWLVRTIDGARHSLVFTAENRADLYAFGIRRQAQASPQPIPGLQELWPFRRSRTELIRYFEKIVTEDKVEWAAIDHLFPDGGRLPLQDLIDHLYSLPDPGEDN